MAYIAAKFCWRNILTLKIENCDTLLGYFYIRRNKEIAHFKG